MYLPYRSAVDIVIPILILQNVTMLIVLMKRQLGMGQIAQLIAQTQIQSPETVGRRGKLGVDDCAYNSITREVKTGGSLGLTGQSAHPILENFRSMRDSVSENTVNET